MKYRWLVAVGAAILFVPAVALAHLPGQPPFVYLNNEMVLYYPVGFTSLTDLAIPQDLAPKNYLVNEEITFRIDESALPLFPEELPFYTFSWDFADGATGTGLELKHTFTTPGSKVISTYSKDSRSTEPAQVLNTLYLNVLPTAEYRLPEPVVSVNGRQLKDLYTDALNADFTKRVTLDASRSKGGTSPIASTVWDLGNRQMSRDAKVTLTYNELFSTVQPVVRVTDSQGFFVDATFQITNGTLAGPNDTVPTNTRRDWLLGGLLAVLALGGGGLLWLRRPTGGR